MGGGNGCFRILVRMGFGSAAIGFGCGVMQLRSGRGMEAGMYFSSMERVREVSKYIEDLRAQDDRSCVIMIAARLEFLLRQAIEKRLLKPRSKSKDSIEHLQFGGCVSLCFRLGLIHRTHADALDALGRIRNMAAHFDNPMALNDDEFRPFIMSFSSPWKADSPESHFHRMYREELSRSFSRERALFVVTASMFFVFLSPLAFITDRLAPLPVVEKIPSVK